MAGDAWFRGPADPARDVVIPILAAIPIALALVLGGPHYAAALIIIGIGGGLFLANPRTFILIFLSLISLRNFVAGGERIGSDAFNFDLGGLVNVLATGIGVVYFGVLWKNPFRGRSLTWPYGTLLAFFAISIFWAPDLRWALRFTTRLGAPFFTYLIISDMLDTRMVSQVVYTIYASSVIPIVYGFFQWITGQGNDITEGYNRVNSSFHHPAHFSMYLVYLFCLAYSELLAGRRQNNALLLVYILCLGALEIATYTRISWLAMGVCFIYLTTVYQRFSYLLAAGTAGAVVILGVGRGIVDRVSSIGDSLNFDDAYDSNTSIGWRFYFWDEILKRFWDSPWIGFGAGSSTILGEELFGTEASPHNGYLRVLYETGAIGSVLFLWVLVVMMWQGVRLLRKNLSVKLTFISHVYITMTFTYILLNLTDNILEYYEVAIYHWAVLSLVEYSNVRAARAGLITEERFEKDVEVDAESVAEMAAQAIADAEAEESARSGLPPGDRAA